METNHMSYSSYILILKIFVRKNILMITEPKESATVNATWNVTGKGRAVEVSLVWKYFGGPRSCFSSVIS